ncbi:MAG TPA: HAMP domain-containing histidine kinase [Candidatus Onthocola stercoravium]|nr:HAMP domain-containing histidine kinase [Candidatus Onthocola stercoravium]
MKHGKIIITITFIVLFVTTIAITYYEYQTYSQLTNEFVSDVVDLIDENYPNIDTSEVIEIINSSDYENNSDILTSYGFTDSDLSILASLENQFHEQLLINIIIIVIFGAIIILGIYLYNLKNKRELNNLIKYLKELNRGNYNLQIDLNSEGILSILKNEIYTTTIMLREKAEKELVDKQNLKDSLTNISHQLKTPLTSISLLVDNLCDEDVPASLQKEFLSDIKTQIDSINYLIIVLLKLSRFDANVITFKEEKINVKNLCIDVLKHIDALRDVKNITIHINGSSNVTFTGDYKWEFEALSNILKNCLEYTSENKNIYVSFKETNMFTEITIQDEGKGMSKEEKRRMFERFYKGENSSNNNFGIGMSLAKEIINKDNGKIKVDSTPDIGSTFKIRYYK